MNRRAALMGLGGGCLFLTGCDEWGDWGSFDRYREEFRITKKLRPGGRLSLENMNGSVEVVVGSGDSVEISGTKYASTPEALRALEIETAEGEGVLHIRTIRPSSFRGGMGAKYTLRVPRQVELDRIVTTNGRITVDGTQGAAHLRSTNGSVTVSRVKGPIEVETTNSSVEVADSDGPANIRTTNGHIRAIEVRGSLSAATTNSSIEASLRDAEQGRPVTVATTNGHIELALPGYRANPVTASTTNSSVTLRLPSNTGARLFASTTNSSVNTDFDVTMNGTVSKTKVEGDINGGGAPIRVATTNGRVAIERL